MKALFQCVPPVGRTAPVMKPRPLKALVMMQIDGAAIERLSEDLARRPDMRRLVCATGPYGLIAEIETSGPADLDEALDEIGKMAGVRRTTSSVVLGVKLAR